MPCPLCHCLTADVLGEKDSYVIVACGDCGLHYVRDMPGRETLAEYYAHYHGNTKNVRNAARKVRRWQRKLWPLKFLARGKSFLEVGCNTGFAVEAARRLGFEATGYDLSDEAVDIARQTYPANTFRHGTAQTAAETGDRHDLVLCAEMIEHLTELGSFADALAQLVRPGGILYLTTPDTGHWRTPKNLLAWKEVCPPHHLMYFNRDQIRRFLERAGFRVSCFFPVLHKPSVRVIARRAL